MRNFIKISGLLFFLFVFIATSFAQYDLSKVKTSKNILDLIKDDMLTWINNKVIVDAVNDSNTKNAKRTMDQINDIDKKWKAGKGAEDIVKSILNNECSVFLREIQKKSKSVYVEIFVMDFQGCNVAMSNVTSDFLQGDEDKFIKSYDKGKGAIYLDKVEFDESSQSYQTKVNLPIVDPKTKKVIGAVSIGIDLEKL